MKTRDKLKKSQQCHEQQVTKTLHVSNTGTKYWRTKRIIFIQIIVLQNSRLHVI